MIPATQQYLKGVERLCRELGILLILDEVKPGMAAAVRCWLSEPMACVPTSSPWARAWAGALPLAALLARGSACCAEAGELEGSHHGNALMMRRRPGCAGCRAGAWASLSSRISDTPSICVRA